MHDEQRVRAARHYAEEAGVVLAGLGLAPAYGKLLGGDDAPGADRLRITRDFYAFVEREMPRLVERFESEYAGGTAEHSGGTTVHPGKGDADG